MKQQTVAKRSAIGLIIAVIALFFTLNMTNPSDGGPAVILLVLLLVYGISYAVIVLAVLLVNYIYRLIAPLAETTTAADKERHAMRRMLAVVAVVSATPIMLISLNSIGQMNFVDFILIAATECLAVFYILKKIW